VRKVCTANEGKIKGRIKGGEKKIKERSDVVNATVG
jgi:hypothetical protein